MSVSTITPGPLCAPAVAGASAVSIPAASANTPARGSLFFGGKRNINEQHHNEPEYDFTISLVATNYGLPAPEVLSLTSLMRTNDNNAATSEDIFDQTRATGGDGVIVRFANRDGIQFKSP